MDYDEIVAHVKRLQPNVESVSDIEFIENGWSNRNYRLRVDGDLAVLRIKNRPPVSASSEVRYLEAAVGLTLLKYDLASGDMLTKWVNGKALYEVSIPPQEAAQYLHALHDSIPTSVERYNVHETIDNYLEGGQVADMIRNSYAELVWNAKSIRGCHNELNAWNVLKTTDGFCTLDWESAGDNDPLFDLVGLCYGMNYSDADFHACVRLYDASVTPEHLRNTRLIYQIREHAWAVDRIKRGSTKPEIFKQTVLTLDEVTRLKTQTCPVA